VTVATATTRLNLGSGRYPVDGWTNVDLVCPADIQGDFRDLDFAGVREVQMKHMLEHISWRETDQVLRHIRSWMADGGRLIVEVPDMDAILKLGTEHPLWFKYVYGDQSHDGEYHRAGFTLVMLYDALHQSGWRNVSVHRFASTHSGREGMPCLLAEAWA
jgi:predicted SAM-dependent methyltransferase